MSEPIFRTDLFRGTAQDYERFRVPYPGELIDDLAQAVGADGTGRLLDLACGTGQIAFALHGRFAETWAVDQEPDMVAAVREKAVAGAIADIRPLASAAELLDAPAGGFALIAVGNAFHRLQRAAVAANIVRWLRPGGFAALLWGDGPWAGAEPWQQAVAATVQRWRARLGAEDRVPADYQQARDRTPDRVVLQEAGLEAVGTRRTFRARHDWTPQSLAGNVYSTSVLPRRLFGALAAEFEQELETGLRACRPDGPLTFTQEADFAYELARRPPAGA
jgi:SAM-dependent methyltransferase